MKSRIVSAVALLLLAVASVSAHHASAGIDRTTTKELKGTIKAFSWQNPHSWMEVEVASEGKVVTWTIEMTAPSYLVRAGWKSSTVKPGDEVTVTVRPSASLTDTNRPPGSPFFSGRTVTVTSSPGFTVVDFHPARTRYDGAVISTVQTTTFPSVATSTSIHECGFCQLKAFIVPLSSLVVVRSMPAEA